MMTPHDFKSLIARVTLAPLFPALAGSAPRPAPEIVMVDHAAV